LVLFALRKLYRQPRSWPNLCLAALVASAFVVVTLALRGHPTGPGEGAFNVILPAMVFCINLLLWYAVLNTLLYYARSRFPAQVAGYLLLFRQHVYARGSGLGLLRGAFAGLGFSGCWMAMLSLAGLPGKALPGMLWWLTVLVFENSSVPSIAPGFPLLLIGEVLMVGWLLVAFPLSLLGRASRRWRVLLPALVALWLAFGFSLAGPMVFPRLPYYLLVVVQAVFFGALFLRYDLLTALSAAFTIEVCLLAVPFLEIFQHIDPVPFLVPIGLLALLLLVAVSLYFRPQLAASYSRITAVFE
jgi:hypothetical protein